TINGDDATIARSEASGTPAFRIFEVAGTGTLHLGDLIIANGLAPAGYSVAGMAGGNGDDGGAIYNAGTLKLSDTYVQLSATGAGGAAGSSGGGGHGGHRGGPFTN